VAAVGRTVSGPRHLSEGQMAYIAAKYLKPAEEEKAKERQAATLKQNQGESVPGNLPERSGDVRDLAAAQVGLSGKTVDAAAKAIENGIPAVEAALAEGRIGRRSRVILGGGF